YRKVFVIPRFTNSNDKGLQFVQSSPLGAKQNVQMCRNKTAHRTSTVKTEFLVSFVLTVRNAVSCGEGVVRPSSGHPLSDCSLIRSF
ncbi:hypothetical protein CRM22_002049, partial [Opisthorchis felineus]